MLAHYTAFRKLRHDDAYTPGGRHGARPNRASIVYTSLVRQTFSGLPVVLGGIEASLRRASHYDFWTDKIRRSLLLDSKADLIVYGMAERSLLEVAKRVDEGASLRGIAGTVYACRPPEIPAGAATLPSHEEILAEPKRLMDATLDLEAQMHQRDGIFVQQAGDRAVVMMPPPEPLESAELDSLYDLPFTRQAHPAYDEPIPAATMIQFSITAHRGCAGGCSFCSLALHQGRRIQSRSPESLVREAKRLTHHPDWDGAITDVGGPSANMWGARCTAPSGSVCRRTSCLVPERCPNFKAEQAELTRLLRRIASLPGVDHLRVASGIRHDLAMIEPAYATALVTNYTGGQLKLAPEHASPRILRLMRKPDFRVFEKFLTLFTRESRGKGKSQYIVPYLMSAFPGCTDDDMRALRRWFRERGWQPQQVQCFIPTPGTVATAMFYGGIDPDGNPIPVARTDAERIRQHHILLGKAQSAPPPRKGPPKPKGPRKPSGRNRGRGSRGQ